MFFDPFLAILCRGKIKQSRSTIRLSARSSQNMAHQPPKPEAAAAAQGPLIVSVQRLVLRIDESRMQEVADRAKLLPFEDSQLVVDFLSKVILQIPHLGIIQADSIEGPRRRRRSVK
jgi:hypothetical protein